MCAVHFSYVEVPVVGIKLLPCGWIGTEDRAEMCIMRSESLQS